MEETIRFKLNGRDTELVTDPNQILLWVLRNNLGLTGTKFGCGIGFCGSCTVLIDNEPVRSCMTAVGDIAGRSVVTIEGMETDGKLHPIQQRARPGAEGLHGVPRPPVRLLHPGDDTYCIRSPRQKSFSLTGGDSGRSRGKPLQVRSPYQDH